MLKIYYTIKSMFKSSCVSSLFDFTIYPGIVVASCDYPDKKVKEIKNGEKNNKQHI